MRAQVFRDSVVVVVVVVVVVEKDDPDQIRCFFSLFNVTVTTLPNVRL
jgi:hypothetical protein